MSKSVQGFPDQAQTSAEDYQRVLNALRDSEDRVRLNQRDWSVFTAISRIDAGRSDELANSPDKLWRIQLIDASENSGEKCIKSAGGVPADRSRLAGLFTLPTQCARRAVFCGSHEIRGDQRNHRRLLSFNSSESTGQQNEPHLHDRHSRAR